VNSDDDEHMLKLWANGLWRKRQSARFLEYDRHDVIANVSFTQQLKQLISDPLKAKENILDDERTLCHQED